jgi:hypothetical protein
MNRYRGAACAGLVRALVVAGVLAGVFAMHGLTIDHAPVSVGRGHPTASHDAATGADPVAVRSGAMTVHSAMAAAARPDRSQTRAGERDPGHAMPAVCVAVLAASVLLLLVSRVLRRGVLGWTYRDVRAWRAVGAGRSGRSPPGSSLSLSKLCVLRI